METFNKLGLGAFCVITVKGVDAAVVWIITAGLTNTLRISGCSRLPLPEGKHLVFYEVPVLREGRLCRPYPYLSRKFSPPDHRPQTVSNDWKTGPESFQ